MISILLEKLFPKKKSEKQKISEYNFSEGIITTCPSCGFKSERTSDFMQIDERNDKCPMCGEETPLYEI